MELIYTVSAVVLLALSIMGTFSKNFDDNLLQRIAMALIAFGSSAFLFCHWDGISTYNPRALLMAGCALYGIGSAVKTWRYSRGLYGTR
ncbi:hypothetical protein J2W35_004965 [Variovorax boronicumulans]|uniref:hypothetical protein n=1 Tax=Variovorax boronicumulans TaxID=436515 RepID=UPI00277D6ABD|nr:hypothetical protein [Variovorax boronicumulans]MDQ0084596.1 hypothetical protein [Variovorax boronicumulans]